MTHFLNEVSKPHGNLFWMSSKAILKETHKKIDNVHLYAFISLSLKKKTKTKQGGGEQGKKEKQASVIELEVLEATCVTM